MAQRVVTRFAPSPTGFMHVGGVRTAIYAWAYARKHRGTFILRIEDTDKEREVEGSVKHIMDSLSWLGLLWDYGPDKPGPWGSAVQSERLSSYQKYAQQLVERGHAYPDPYTKEELDVFRAQAEAKKRPFLFRNHRPATFLPWNGKQTLRFKVLTVKRYVWTDMVRGELSAGEEALDDFILIKSDGYPTYNFAHIVDDIEMGITHIMRGEEFISSMPKFLSVYEALGIEPPVFATLPPILGEGGNKKLSKRDGAKDVLEYRSEGYLPEAVVNFLALLGWHPQDNREVMSIPELVEAFELERVQKGGARFDEEKLRWFNSEHLHKLSNADFGTRFTELFGQEMPLSLAPLIKERAHTLLEARDLLGEYDFLDTSISYDPTLLLQGGKIPKDTASAHLQALYALVEKLPEAFSSDNIKNALFPYATEHGRGAVLWPLRVALAGREKSPDPFSMASLMGKEKTLSRIAQALESL